MRFRYIALALLSVCVFSAPSYAASKVHLPVTSGKVTNNYARVDFKWQSPVDFIATANGKTVTIKFDHPTNINTASLVANLSPYITSVKQKDNGKTLIISMDKPYKIRSFLGHNSGGIDLLGISPNAQKLLAAKKEEDKKLLLLNNEKKAKKYALISTARDEKIRKLVELAPAAGVPEPAKPEAVKPAKLGKPEPVKEVSKEATADAENDSVAKPPSSLDKSSEFNVVSVSAGDEGATLRFTLAERTALAVFARNHHLWVVLGKPLKLDLSEFTDMEKTVIGKPEIIANAKATIVYFPMDDNVYASVRKEEKSNSWVILLSQQEKPLAFPIVTEVSTAPPAPAHVMIPTLEMSEPILVNDPTIGDQLVVTPLFKTGEAIADSRDFIEFSLLKTFQGVAVAKKADGVEIIQLRNGLRVTTEKGASISPNLPKLEVKAVGAAVKENPTLYPNNLWKAATDKPRSKQLQKLFHQIVESKNLQDANDARLRMAQIYLSEGLAPEAIALLDGINRTSPSFYRSAKLSGVRGAANFLMSRFVESAKDFSSAELNNNKEMDYWRSMLSELLGNAGQTYDYLALNTDYISKYPPIFRQKLAIVAADRAIAAQDYNVALKIFDSLHQDNLLDSINVYINFLLAKIAMATGQEKEGLEGLEKLAEDYKHPFVKSRAVFTLIARDLEAGGDKEQIIDRLEKLRLNWHGDSLELQILSILGELYTEKKDYVNAMRVWNNGVQGFKNTSVAIDMANKMSETFIMIFSEGAIADKLPPLEALAIYYEYRAYMPSGTAGSEMTDRLAEKLISVDLLDQAVGVLDRQMKTQAEKEQRSQIGAKIAAIHLMNNQPQKALLTLQDSVYGGNSALLRLLRNRLTAEAMADSDKTDIALQTLNLDDSADAERIRISIYWKVKNWEKLTTSIENILKLRPDITAPITVDESEYLIKLALAYMFENNKEQIHYLRDYFTPLMVNNPNFKVFEYVTADDITPTSRNFDEVLKSLSNTRSFIAGYKARINIGAIKK